MRFALLLGMTCLLVAQQVEVASIRRSSTVPPDAGRKAVLTEDGNHFRVDTPVKWLIEAAFHLKNAQIVGAPAWLENDRYDIETRKTATPQEFANLMQGLLADRFQMKSHFETREVSVYALVLTSSGKLNKSVEGQSNLMTTYGGRDAMRVEGIATPMDEVADYVGNYLDEIVVDQTGLQGTYNFTLQWSVESPSLTAALREQLGLSLEWRMSPMSVLVIDNINHPSEN